MNCFVLGAGVSKSVGYPLGSELFDEIDKFVRESGQCVDRFDYQKDWDRLRNWFEQNSNPAIVQAYATRNIEHIFTALDFVEHLRNEALVSVALAKRNSAERASRSDVFEKYDELIADYRWARRILLWALEHYFSYHHHRDFKDAETPDWDALRRFGETLRNGDIVITFNYDVSLERVLFQQGKWSPSDGFGFELKFQESRFSNTQVNPWPNSAVKVLHLHGATGWYSRPTFVPGLEPQGSGAVSREVFGPAPLETQISLDPQFLEGLGVFHVDASLPDKLSVATEPHVVIHPSFLKDYLAHEGVIPPLWRRAAEELRRADRVFVVGYSLPDADSASLTLLLTNVNQGTARIVNPNGAVKMKLGRLLRTGDSFDGTAKFEDWVAVGCPDRIPWRPHGKDSYSAVDIPIVATPDAS